MYVKVTDYVDYDIGTVGQRQVAVAAQKWQEGSAVRMLLGVNLHNSYWMVRRVTDGELQNEDKLLLQNP